jgi:hypothetical protein
MRSASSSALIPIISAVRKIASEAAAPTYFRRLR